MTYCKDDTPRLYVGTYAKYNNGSIQGAWLDLDDYIDKDDFYQACHDLHSNESDPEFMFQDFEGFPKYLYEESGGIDLLYEFLNLDDWEREIVGIYLDYEYESDFQSIIDRYHGTYDSMEDYAYQYADECMNIPDSLQNYIDYERLANDMSYDFTVVDHDSGEVSLYHN